jgi:hypothetical protein
MSYATRDRCVSPELFSATDPWCCPVKGEVYLLKNPGPVNGGVRGGRKCAAKYIEKNSHEQAPLCHGALDHTNEGPGPVHAGTAKYPSGQKQNCPFPEEETGSQCHRGTGLLAADANREFLDLLASGVEFLCFGKFRARFVRQPLVQLILPFNA